MRMQFSLSSVGYPMLHGLGNECWVHVHVLRVDSFNLQKYLLDQYAGVIQVCISECQVQEF